MSQPLLTRTFLTVTAAHFLQALGYATMLLLPLYLDHLGANRSQVGTIMATAAVGGLALRPVAGWALDTLGRRPTLAVGTVVLVISMAMIGLIDSLGPLIYVQRVLLGIGVGTLMTAYLTYASDVIPPARRTEGIALFGISGLLPLALNAFAQDLGFEAAELRWFFPGVGAAIALSLILIWLLPEPDRPNHGQNTASEGPGLLKTLTSAPLLPVWLATGVFAGLVATFMAFATVSAQSCGVDWPAGLWLTYAAGAIGVRLFGAKLPDKLGPTNIVAPALACYAGAMLLTAWATTATHFQVAGLLAGLGHGFCFPVLTSQTVSRCPPQQRGSALATFTALWDILVLSTMPLAGFIADAFDDRTMFSGGALIALIGLGFWAALEHRAAGQLGRAQDPTESTSST